MNAFLYVILLADICSVKKPMSTICPDNVKFCRRHKEEGGGGREDNE